MELGIVDILVFFAFVIAVVSVGLLKSRKEKTGEDYFLAGRGLSWWLIGFSLIAANISTEQFVGMSGNAASHVGLAIASYEWMAAITLVVVAFFFLPYFLKAGVYTMPEFLEYRYNSAARTFMAIATLLIYMLLLGAVTYSGALTISTLGSKMDYNIPLASGALVIGIIAMAYVAAGGLKACAWADLIQGSALIVGGAIIMIFAFIKLGNASEVAYVVDVGTGAVGFKTMDQVGNGLSKFWQLNNVRMNMILPANDPVLPCTALLLGLWIPNFYYWGLNQYINQRTLGSSSLAHGQKGIVFAAFMKLLIPFVIVVPGIIAFNLYAKDMQLESVGYNTKVLAQYVKANPSTEYIDVVSSPSQAILENMGQDKFMLAVFDDNKIQVKDLKIKNPHILPIEKNVYESLSVNKYTIFVSEDKAWDSMFSSLAAEIKGYNASVIKSAAVQGKPVTTEKLIAFKYDTALAQLLGNVLPQKVGLLGFVLAALLGAVVSSLAAMLNASSTIFTIDIYKKFIFPNAGQNSIVFVGRVCVVIFSVIAVILAPQMGNPKISNSIFTIIQEGQGLISPGILAIFAFGFVVRRAPRIAGVTGLITNIIAYSTLKCTAPSINFLNRMAICFGLCLVVMIVLRLVVPMEKPIEFKSSSTLDLTTSKSAKILGIVIVILTLILYYIFSPIGFAK